MAGLDKAYHPNGEPVRWNRDAWARLRVRREQRNRNRPTRATSEFQPMRLQPHDALRIAQDTAAKLWPNLIPSKGYSDPGDDVVF